MTGDVPELTRRRFVTATSAGSLAGLVGLSASVSGQTGEPLEVLHGWTGGDGEQAIDNLTSVFGEQHSDVETDFKPIGGGGNRNLDTVVANRLSNRNPPSSFANWPGKNLVKYEGVLGSVNDVWEEEGFTDSHVQEAVDLHKNEDGDFVAVPIGSHRLNNLFYNVSVVEEAGVDPDSLTSVSALMDALETVASETDKTPMTHGMNGVWTTLQLFAVVMLGQEGFEPYMNFIRGEGDENAVRSTFETLEEILTNYISDDAASIGLTESNQNIVNGNAAFIHQGNWAAGAYRNAEDFDYDEDWGAKTFPGTENMYMLHFDSFLYPSDNPTPETTRTWLRFVGGEDAQIAFNRFKGSIPTRTDVSKSEFGPYLQETMDDFSEAEQRPPTLAHGLAVVADKMTALSDVLSNNFTGPYDVDAATNGFMNAVSN